MDMSKVAEALTILHERMSALENAHRTGSQLMLGRNVADPDNPGYLIDEKALQKRRQARIPQDEQALLRKEEYTSP